MLEFESRFAVTDAHTSQYFAAVTMPNPMKDVDTAPSRIQSRGKGLGFGREGTQTRVNSPSTS